MLLTCPVPCQSILKTGWAMRWCHRLPRGNVKCACMYEGAAPAEGAKTRHSKEPWRKSAKEVFVYWASGFSVILHFFNQACLSRFECDVQKLQIISTSFHHLQTQPRLDWLLFKQLWVCYKEHLSEMLKVNYSPLCSFCVTFFCIDPNEK